jgi:hypothetical protein
MMEFWNLLSCGRYCRLSKRIVSGKIRSVCIDAGFDVGGGIGFPADGGYVYGKSAPPSNRGESIIPGLLLHAKTNFNYPGFFVKFLFPKTNDLNSKTFFQNRFFQKSWDLSPPAPDRVAPPNF